MARLCSTEDAKKPQQSTYVFRCRGSAVFCTSSEKRTSQSIKFRVKLRIAENYLYLEHRVNVKPPGFRNLDTGGDDKFSLNIGKELCSRKH